MKVRVRVRPKQQIERYEYRDAMAIDIDGKKAFGVSDGEVEDSNLSRDFNDCYQIPDLLKKAFDAGKNGETFEITRIDDEDL